MNTAPSAWNKVAASEPPRSGAASVRKGQPGHQTPAPAPETLGGTPRRHAELAREEADASLGARTPPAAGRVSVGSPRAFQIDVLKTPGMSLRTVAGKTDFYARVILRLVPYASEEQAAKAAAELIGATIIQPAGHRTVTQMEERFERAEPGTPFIFNVYPSFLWQLNKHVTVPYELLYPEQAGETGAEKLPKRPTALWQPLLAQYTLAERIAWAGSRIAEARRRRPDVPHRYEAGRVYGNLMFIYHPYVDYPDQQVWMTADGRLFQIDERQIKLEAFRQGVVSAAPMAMVAWIVVGATALLAGGYLVATAAPEVGATALNWVLSDLPRAYVVADFSAGTLIKIISAGGPKEFMAGMATPEGAAQTLFEILTLRMMVQGAKGGTSRQVSIRTRVQSIKGNEVALVVEESSAPGRVAVPAIRATIPPPAEEQAVPPSPAMAVPGAAAPAAEGGKLIPVPPGQRGAPAPRRSAPPAPGPEPEEPGLRRTPKARGPEPEEPPPHPAPKAPEPAKAMPTQKPASSSVGTKLEQAEREVWAERRRVAEQKSGTPPEKWAAQRGGATKRLYNLLERRAALLRAKVWPNRTFLEQAEVVGVEQNGVLTPTSKVSRSGKGRIPDVVEVNGQTVVLEDLKSPSTQLKGVKGGVRPSEQIEAEFRSNSEIAKQHTVEQEVIAHARNTGGQIVIEGIDVVTGARVRLKVHPGNVSSRVTDYNALPGN